MSAREKELLKELEALKTQMIEMEFKLQGLKLLLFILLFNLFTALYYLSHQNTLL